MSEQSDPTTTPDAEDDVTTDPSFSLDGLTDDEVAALVENTRIEDPDGGEMPLEAAMLDLAMAHKELEEYKQGALTMYQHLDERLHEAEANGQDDLAHLLREVKTTAYGVFLRLHRGDAELLGEREGKFAGYFDSDEPTPTPDDHTEEVDGAS